MISKKLIVAGAISTLAVFAFAQARSEYLAGLSGTGKGKARYKSAPEAAELQVEGERLSSNATYIVSVPNAMWTVTTNGFGSFRLAQRFGANRPAIVAGTPITVSTPAGATVQSGVFAAK